MFLLSAYKTQAEPQQGYSVKWEKYRKLHPSVHLFLQPILRLS